MDTISERIRRNLNVRAEIIQNLTPNNWWNCAEELDFMLPISRFSVMVQLALEKNRRHIMADEYLRYRIEQKQAIKQLDRAYQPGVSGIKRKLAQIKSASAIPL